ncbi:MAG: hypothetical protein BRC29_00615 [Nanohaloarchaea archaeon SW_7_43_1]|nr:MAG: hypothetical protein BRC29_00615 [Nanohaloarchaea archaeon SW_7_43_1]
MTVASVDDQGRLYLPKEIRNGYTDKFRIIETQDEILLLPLPEDPLESFQEEEALEDKSIEELKEDVRKDSREQATK